MSSNRVVELKERVARFDEAIDRFTRLRESLQSRRSGATDHVMVEIDDRLAANHRALEAFTRGRAVTLEDLAHEELLSTSTRAHRFAVIDGDSGGRDALAHILTFYYPHAAVIACETSIAAIEEVRHRAPAAVLLRRTIDMDELSLVQMLRQANASIPIICISTVDRSDAALAAGATTFLRYDQTHLLGQVIAALLRPRVA